MTNNVLYPLVNQSLISANQFQSDLTNLCCILTEAKEDELLEACVTNTSGQQRKRVCEIVDNGQHPMVDDRSN